MDAIESAKLRVLVVKCQMGERAALEALFLRYNPALTYYLRRLLDRDDVADVLQEVWLRVIRRLRTLRSPEAFTVWLYRIARSKALDQLSQRKPPEQFDEAPDGGDFPDEEEPEFSAEDGAPVHAALGRLPAAQRDALTLRFLEGLSYEQIAEVTHCTVGTVRSRLHYAKAAMRQLLETDYERNQK
jgi:RNA polymerase sigma-70 factor (ECF subfamily)